MVPSIQDLSNLAQALGFLVAFAALFVAIRQNATAHAVARGQNFFALIGFLQESSLRAARAHVQESLNTVAFEKWNAQDKSLASTVCSSYDAAIIALKKQFIDHDIFIDNYGPSVRDCYHICQPLILERQHARGPSYWDDFAQLGKQLLDTTPYTPPTAPLTPVGEGIAGSTTSRSTEDASKKTPVKPVDQVTADRA
ncbi:MAG: hypothetical protein Q8L44_11590 [Sulfuritalea sp.]|nr:hypothetical protein [Sulfuritalea sp.]